MLSVCSTAPIDGMARYAVKCSALFHMKVATRWSPVMPMRRNAFANLAGLLPELAIAVVCRYPSPVAVVTVRSPCTIARVSHDAR